MKLFEALRKGENQGSPLGYGEDKNFNIIVYIIEALAKLFQFDKTLVNSKLEFLSNTIINPDRYYIPSTYKLLKTRLSSAHTTEPESRLYAYHISRDGPAP